MPSRIIREGLLDSQRYWSVTIEARQLFVHLMLLADDFGLVSLAPVFIRRRAFSDAPPQSKVDQLIGELVHVDLLRTYEVEQARYGFVPRFRQILRIEKARHPMPPDDLFSDDVHAREKFLKNKDKFTNLHSRRTADDRQMHSGRMPEVKRSEGKGTESKRSEDGNDAVLNGSAPHQETPNPVDKRVNGKTLEERAQAVGLKQTEGEARNLFMLRVASAESKARTTQ